MYYIKKKDMSFLNTSMRFKLMRNTLHLLYLAACVNVIKAISLTFNVQFLTVEIHFSRSFYIYMCCVCFRNWEIILNG